MANIDTDIAAVQSKLEELKYKKNAIQTRERAEALWQQAKLYDFGPDQICEHYSHCRNVRVYIPQTGTPKATLALLPLPAHPQRKNTPGFNPSCPGCDVHQWAQCLRKAGANPTLPSDPGADKLLETIEAEA